ncbi:MAG: bifunctional ornithine acetyltransferase/N-acetylglutamate synthase [Thermoleophilia bacterium]
MSVTAARGFVAGGVHCGIRRAASDLAIVRSVEPAVGAALFTVNRVLAAPCAVSQLNLAQAEPQAVVLNSGVANAATGERGSSTRSRPAPRPGGCSGCGPRRCSSARPA